MSYGIGQFRKTQLDKYMDDLHLAQTTKMGTETARGATSGDIVFNNPCVNLEGASIADSQHCYYLQFGVSQTNTQQRFLLKLHNTSHVDNDNEQLIDEFVVPTGNSTTYFETILAPNASYNQILFELERIAADYQGNGRTMNVTLESYSKLIDVMETLKHNYSGLDHLTKIGVQGPPSMLMCINREAIRIGRTGIYELNIGIDVTSISFVPKSGDYFIMDFEY